MNTTPIVRFRDAHRGWARAAVLLSTLAIAGAFLPWFQSDLLRSQRTAGSEPNGDIAAVIRHALLFGPDEGSVRGFQGEGKFVVAFLFLGLGAAWVTLARWLQPLSTRPGHALLLSCLLLFTGALLIFFEGLSVWTPPGIASMTFHIAYGWWISLVASVIAALCALLALRRAMAAADAALRASAPTSPS